MTIPLTSLLYILFGLSLVLVTLSVLLRGGRRGIVDTYNTPARFFLVAVRLAIGWHFFVEGMDKFESPNWSSEAYLRESVGPLASSFRRLAGDRLLDRVTAGDDKQIPPRLATEWQAYLDAFANHYELDDDQQTRAQAAFDQRSSATAEWLRSGKEEVEKISAYPPALKVTMTMPERIAEYRRLEAKAAEAEARLPNTDPEVQKKAKDAKADVAKWRAGIKKSLDAQTAEYKDALRTVLTKEQKAEQPPVAPEEVHLPWQTWEALDWSDKIVTWGLLVLGGALLLGLFSRLASALGALLVLSFYLAMPPLPGWPESPRLEGHYLLINKTLIEALMLGALAFIPTGRWAGLDGLLQLLLPAPRASRRVVADVPVAAVTAGPR